MAEASKLSALLAAAEAAAPMVMRTYKFRLLPRKGQHQKLKLALDQTRDLYNAALEERIGAFRKCGETRSYIVQCGGLTELRTDPAFTQFAVAMQRWPLKKLDLAFRAFFSRVKHGEKPGFPRFRGKDRFKSFGFTDRDGWSVEGRRLRINGIGRVAMHLHRPLPSAPIACQIKQDSKGWVALLACQVPVEPIESVGHSVGLDLGITSFVAMSDGETIPGFRAGHRAQTEMRRRQRALARCKRGSRNRRKAKARLASLHAHVGNARRTFQHQLAARIVRENDLIAIEDLNVKGLARSIRARDVHDAGWTSFTQLLAEKAEKAARTLVRVDRRFTSQTCPDCGTVKPKDLSERVHRCECGLTLDRDVAAAKVILMRAVASPLSHNVGGCAVRAA